MEHFRRVVDGSVEDINYSLLSIDQKINNIKPGAPEVGETTTGAPGTPAAVEVTKDGKLNFTIPEGEPGPPGPPGRDYISGAFYSVASYSVADCERYAFGADPIRWEQSQIQPQRTPETWAVGLKVVLIISCENGNKYYSYQTVTGADELKPDKVYYIAEKGDQGEPGAKGDPGKQGDQGRPGDPGAAATIEIAGTQTQTPSSPAEVTNIGTETKARFYFKIPQGFKGDTGEKGEQGFSIVHNNAPTLSNTREQWDNALARPSNLWACTNSEDFKIGDIMQLFGSVTDENNKKLQLFGVVDEIDVNGNLKTSKNFIIEDGDRGEAGKMELPVDWVYTQWPGEKSPLELWPDQEWRNISANFAGAFVRVEGGNAKQFGTGRQEEGLPNIKGKIGSQARGEGGSVMLYGTEVFTTLYGDGIYNLQYQNILNGVPKFAELDASRMRNSENKKIYGNSEHNTPENYSVRIWKRFG